MNILLIEDEARVADFVSRGLKSDGHVVTVAQTGPDGLERARADRYDVIILDLMLPGMHGHDVCRALRSVGDRTPILMLTAMDLMEDKVKGLRLGADDYMTKPFAFDELVARLEALARRGHDYEAKPTTLAVGDLVFDRDTLEVHRAGRPVPLTAKELALLELLMSGPGKVFSRSRILSNVWGYDSDPLTNVVDVYIRRLRVKIETDPLGPGIETVRGFGYRLVARRDTRVPERPDGGGLARPA